MSRRRLAALTLLAIAVQAPGTAMAECPAEPVQTFVPCELRVAGDPDAWRAENVFGLRWSNPPGDGGQAAAAVHYRVLDPLGRIALEERTIGWPAESIDHLAVPFQPGAYTAEVWLEDAAGGLGPPAAAKLRFDDARPGRVDPLPAPGWIGRPAFPYAIRLGRPQGAQPLSGIRGYAVAVDRDPEGDPCAAADRCAEPEVDLGLVAEDDTLSLAALPEGTSYVHAVAVSGSGMKSTAVGHAVLRVDTTDPVTRLSGAPDGWASHPVSLTATATDAASGMAPSIATPTPFTAIRVDGGAPVTAPGDTVGAAVIGSGVHAVAYYARDAAGNVDDGGAVNGHANAPPATATVRIDLEPPDLAFASVQDPHDPEAIEARIVDSLSGPGRSGGRISVRRAGSSDRFEPLPTEVSGDALRARWDSDAYPAGSYEFRATGFDLAGNAGATARRANGSRMALDAPLKTPTKVSIQFEGGSGPRPLPVGRGATLSGSLIGGRRAPLGGMPVRVVERFDAGSAVRERASTATTDASGEFALRLRPGPSRSIVATFAGTATLSRSRSRALRLDVRGGVRMRASSPVARVGGRPVVFSGRVRGAEIPPGGVYVQLQFRLPGVPWSEFRTIRTDSRGRFRYAYRFSDDDSRGVRFRFRAYAPAQGGWPYEAAASRPVAVRGS